MNAITVNKLMMLPDPCPFCGSFDIEVIQLPITGDYQYGCESCGASAKSATTKSEARKLWNSRPSEKALRELLALEKEKNEKLYNDACRAMESYAKYKIQVSKRCECAPMPIIPQICNKFLRS